MNIGNRKWRIGRNFVFCRIVELGSYVDFESLFGVILLLECYLFIIIGFEILNFFIEFFL